MEALLKSLPEGIRPKLLIPGNLSRIGYNTNKNELDDYVPILAIGEHIRSQWGRTKKSITLLLSGTGTGKSLTLATFLRAAFDNLTEVIIGEPQITIVENVTQKIDMLYPEYTLGINFGQVTGNTESNIRASEPGIHAMTTGVMVQFLQNADFGDGDTPAYIFILDEAHNRTSGFVYACIEIIMGKIANGENIAVVFTSATLDVENMKSSLRNSMAATDMKKAPTEEHFGLDSLENSVIEVLGDPNGQRLERYLMRDVDDIFPVCLEFLIQCKMNKSSDEYRTLNKNSNVLLFLGRTCSNRSSGIVL